ncbi:MAG: pyocin activator PrtN family protein [Xanthobacteraceae bacterium]
MPVVRMETSQKSARGVHLCDLADYLDKRRAAALKECQQLYGAQ